MLSPEERQARIDHASAISAHWPERIIELSREWAADPIAGRETLLGEIWSLLNMALLRYLRVHRKRYEYGDDDDLRDVASQKSLELLNKLDSQQWRPAEGSPAQLCSFVSTLARNGLIDHLRVVGSKRPRSSGSLLDTTWDPETARENTEPGASVDRDDFAVAIKECAAQLQPRVRTIWFLRVFLEMSAKKIADHPAVDMKPGTIDVTLSRCRDAVKKCMKRKGFDTSSVPPGAFVALWEAFESDLRNLT